MNRQSKLASWQQLKSDAEKPGRIEIFLQNTLMEEVIHELVEDNRNTAVENIDNLPISPANSEEPSIPDEGIGLSDYLKSNHPEDEEVRPIVKTAFQKKSKKSDD